MIRTYRRERRYGYSRRWAANRALLGDAIEWPDGWWQRLLWPITSRIRQRLVRKDVDRPGVCWAEAALWSITPELREDRPGVGSSKRCEKDAKECGSCWCGKFQSNSRDAAGA